MNEFRALLPPDIEIVGLVDLGITSPEETGATVRENAELKAIAAAQAADMLTLADDTGLEVEALHGEPGVRAARFAGEPPDEVRNREMLLAALANTAPDGRGAKFVCAVALASRQGLIEVVDGTIQGSIGNVERGNLGFGYDSIFELVDGRTLAELSPVEKNTLSHRAAAVKAILPAVQSALAAGDAQQRITS